MNEFFGAFWFHGNIDLAMYDLVQLAFFCSAAMAIYSIIPDFVKVWLLLLTYVKLLCHVLKYVFLTLWDQRLLWRKLLIKMMTICVC